MKGLGGYHLACLAGDEAAVGALRARKHREDRPFALLAPTLAAARELVELSPAAEALLVRAGAPDRARAAPTRSRGRAPASPRATRSWA